MHFVIYYGLVKVPALSCRLGRVPYDRAFGALLCAPYPLQKSLTKEKLTSTGFNLVPSDL